VQIVDVAGKFDFDRMTYGTERSAFQTVGIAVFLKSSVERLNCPLRMRCINSMPEIVVAALLNRLRPGMTFVRDLMFRWSCSIRLFRYFEDLTSVSAGSKPSAFNQAVAPTHASPHSRVIQILRVLRLGEEEPPLRNETRVLHQTRGGQQSQ
jgi:hypothetical protein